MVQIYACCSGREKTCRNIGSSGVLMLSPRESGSGLIPGDISIHQSSFFSMNCTVLSVHVCWQGVGRTGGFQTFLEGQYLPPRSLVAPVIWTSLLHPRQVASGNDLSLSPVTG